MRGTNREKAGICARAIERLPVKLSEAEVVERLREMARLYGQIEAIDRELAAAKDRARRDRKSLEDLLSVLAGQARTASEDRDVECEERPDWKACTVTVVRLDTGAIVRVRDMTDQERQCSFAGVALT